ncbi:2-octaprenyl-3-methyl-6-methoxy-1,4-benzoquinol hydroxylase [Hartmannibacter diazotrophicus]|uniref:2-octaprenyl-3-methyl-6-methoxy-1,4-benzoquinol hydroxylase n=1 Tax=Hartmannibacter diazotrophicus TaxID=1482074 RepID=A0A2C9D6P8_9HYPH|nr:UbiH/UbiF family hydroxylase [Hartmannibacter diazotrophicus]SON56004.1 2-octaprenyl-3-methyl-6-methoxy-1,4-benzoquinol hydroxylase [Hartmannibacter diazotrophicus]
MAQETDIVVVGGGPSGMIAALAAARSGYRTVLVAPPLSRPDHRTTALLGSSVAFLKALDVWDRLQPKAAALRTMRLIDGTNRLIRAPETAFEASEMDLEAFGYNIENTELNAVLAEAIDGEERIARVESAAKDIAVSPDRCSITTDDGTTIDCRLVIGADGRNSPVRQAAGIDVKRWTYDQVALVLNVRHTAPHEDTSTELHTETGPFTLVPLGPLRSSIVCVERPKVVDAMMALSDQELARDLGERSHFLLGKLSIDGPRQAFPLSGLSAARMVGDRVALVGEAAHAFPPIGAQGLNLGIRDVADLSRVLEKSARQGEDPGSEGTLARYARARRVDVASRTMGVDLLNRSLLTDFLPVQMARSIGLEVARSIKPLRRLLMREGLAPGYRA